MNNFAHKIFGVILFFSLSVNVIAGQWYQKESENFIIIYRAAHAYLVPHITAAAEKSLTKLRQIFDYEPSEKIIINTYDFSDYGRAGTTTVPQNFIRLQIEPLELAYESMTFNERFQWLISHELVHIVVNDQATQLEAFSRKLFSKVPPESKHPATIFYSLLTNQSRYSPRWHQEGIAVFMETWLNGGYGRLLGNFDEMYFRAKAFENSPLPSEALLDAKISYQSFLVETLFYLYGARFNAYLAEKYGERKLLDWYLISPGDFYANYRKKFKRVYGISMDDAWRDFTDTETAFQRENIARLKSAPVTPITPLRDEPLGWVTSAYLEKDGKSVIIGYHHPHQLSRLGRLDLRSGKLKNLGLLPSPSILQVTSSAYDPELRLFFYTANNSKLFRDVYARSTVSGKSKLLFRDVRVGQLTISPKTHELWGVRHHAGRSSLVYSAYPFANLIPVVGFEIGDNLQNLSVSPSGDHLAAILHQASGRQALIIADVERLRKGKNFAFSVVTEEGSPEAPSWSPDENYLYWNAYPNGVSNIYRFDRKTSSIDALSHTIRGLFKPLYLSADSLFAFEFTSEGFQAVRIPNRPAERLPAIAYFGQKVIDRNPEVTKWSIGAIKLQIPKETKPLLTHPYRGSRNLHFQSHIPIITGFQSQIAVGMYSHITDPLYIHDLTVQIAATPQRQNSAQPWFHVKAKYAYRQKYSLGVEHNAPDFYDLFNERKRGFIGTKLDAGYTKYWKYDIPHKIKQSTDISLYTGIEAINDNLVRVSRPDFFIFQSALSSTAMRRAIGSVDNEFGPEWSLTAMFFGIDPFNDLRLVGGFHGGAGYYWPWLWYHNIFHLKIAGGIRNTSGELSNGRFYLGGFGNRGLDTQPVRQYRKPLRFPGTPIYTIVGSRFLKAMIENTLPPLRFGHAGFGQHHLTHVDVSLYSQGLWIDSAQSNAWGDLGGQINFVFKHWANLESTLSFGAAQAWWDGGNNFEWFVSFKLLKN